MFFNIVGKRLFTTAAPKIKNNKLKPTGMQACSPYILYVKEQMSNSTGTDVSERMSKIAKQWNALNPTQKKKYEILSQQEKDTRLQEFEKLSLEEKQEMRAKDREARQERVKRRERKERREMWETTKHPQRPPNALQLFVKEQFELKKKNNESLTPVTERLKEIVAKWKDLPESDKKPFIEKSEKLREEYKVAVAEWQKKQKLEASSEKAN